MAILTKRRTTETVSVAAIVAASTVLVWAWGRLGDYPNDGGPPISDFLHGHFTSFFHREPAMGSLALFLRLPFAALAFLGSPTPRNVYLYGSVPCVAAVGLLGWWLARIARAHGTGGVGQAAIVAVSLVNPLVRSALEFGHPEELLTASLAVGALVAATRHREVGAAVLLGLALATKQWSVVVVLPILMLATNRRRSALISLGTALVVSLPLIAGSPTVFLHTQLGLIHQQYLEPAEESWLYPLAPSVVRHIVIDGQAVALSVARLPATVVGLLHPLIVLLSALLAGAVWRRARGRPSRDEVFALVALILLARCTLDTETMPYYHVGLVLTLLAWDSACGERIPTRALAATGAAYVVADWLPGVATPATISAIYAAATLGAAVLLLRAMAACRSDDRSPRTHAARDLEQTSTAGRSAVRTAD